MNSIVKRLSFIEQLLLPNDIALEDDACSLSYRELINAIKRCAAWLKSLDVKVVALYGSNSIDWVVIDLACQEAGIIFVPLPTFFSRTQLKRCLLQLQPEMIIGEPINIEKLVAQDFRLSRIKPYLLSSGSKFTAYRAFASNNFKSPEATQKITFTSGSTGTPKGVCLSQQHQWQVAQSLADVIGLKKPKHLCLLPLSTLLENIAGVYSPLLSGGHIVLASAEKCGLSGSSGLEVKQLLTCIEQVQPTTMILIPQLLSALVAACEEGWQPPLSLKFIAVGGAKVSTDLIAVAHNFSLPVYQGYGLSECASVVALNVPAFNNGKQQHNKSVGHVLPHCRVSVDEGNISVKGSCHLGHLDDPGSWYPEQIDTGDLGSLNDGYLNIDGRKKNMLISSFGRNISPEWVEAELLASPCLSQCMVVGDAKPYLAALIFAAKATTNKQIEEWVWHVNQQLPDYARVLAWQRIVDSSLKPYLTANGRLQRKKIEQAFASEIERCYLVEPVLTVNTMLS